LLMDVCRKGWALRYLREATDEIKIAQKDSRAFSLIFDALRKVEMAVCCCLGEPSLIEDIVEEFVERGLTPKDPILKCLVEIKKTVKRLESILQDHLSSVSFRELDNILSAASKIVDLMTSLCTED